MKCFAVLFLLIFLTTADAGAQWRKRKPHWPATEGEMMNKLLSTLRHGDTAAYFSLFPTFDTLWSMVIHNTSNEPDVQKELNHLREHPQVLIEFDPLYNHSIVSNYANVLAKGEDSGVLWHNMVMARYELYKAPPTQGLVGYDRIAPERFQGYMFINDPSNRLTFCIRVAEIQKIKKNFFGGQVLNILQAKSVDEFTTKEAIEQDYYAWLAEHPDTVLSKSSLATKSDTSGANDTSAEENDPLLLVRNEEEEGDDNSRKQVIDRRYYEGTIDEEEPIALYIRFMKRVPGKEQQYDGLYRLGENKRYLKLEITRTEDGRWLIEDESAVGTMELKLNGRTFKGSWSNADENGYDILLTRAGAPKGKIELMDQIIDEGLDGKIDESQFDDEIEEEKKKQKELAEQQRKEKESISAGGGTETDNKKKTKEKKNKRKKDKKNSKDDK